MTNINDISEKSVWQLFKYNVAMKEDNMTVKQVLNVLVKQYNKEKEEVEG